MTPSCIPIKAVKDLKGEPGGYSPCKTRSNKGLEIVSYHSFVKFLERSLPTNNLGS